MQMKQKAKPDCCPTRSISTSAKEDWIPLKALQNKPLLSFLEAVKIMALFKVLANDTRIRLLHHLIRSGEASVTDIAKTLGMKPQAVSNQLQKLSDTRMVTSRRVGNHILYRVMNVCVAPLLDLALCLMSDVSQNASPSPLRKQALS